MCAQALVLPFRILSSRTIDEEVWPNLWRLHRVRPIHKNGSFTNPSNYRGLHITCHIWKLVERMLKLMMACVLRPPMIAGPKQCLFAESWCNGRACIHHTYLASWCRSQEESWCRESRCFGCVWSRSKTALLRQTPVLRYSGEHLQAYCIMAKRSMCIGWIWRYGIARVHLAWLSFPGHGIGTLVVERVLFGLFGCSTLLFIRRFIIC